MTVLPEEILDKILLTLPKSKLLCIRKHHSEYVNKIIKNNIDQIEEWYNYKENPNSITRQRYYYSYYKVNRTRIVSNLMSYSNWNHCNGLQYFDCHLLLILTQYKNINANVAKKIFEECIKNKVYPTLYTLENIVEKCNIEMFKICLPFVKPNANTLLYANYNSSIEMIELIKKNL